MFPESKWASLNKGLFLCAECASIHRTLGRQVSRIIRIEASPPQQLQMLRGLQGTANDIWEHALKVGNSSIQTRPGMNATLDEKAAFIKAKHEKLEFALSPEASSSFSKDS